MDINEFRSKYPQYDAMDDETLATKLYEKSYVGKIDRSEFDRKFLGKEEQSFLGSVGDSIAGGVGAAWNAIKGDAAMDMGNINDAGITGEGLGGKAKLAAAGIFGSDDDIAESVRKQYPDAQFSEDENGNPYVTLPDGRQGYINKPGLDLEDITRGAGKLASFLPAAGAAGLAGKLGGFGARVAAGGVASGATDAVMQKAAGREEIDGGQVAVTGLLGAGAEALAPAIGLAARKVSERMGAKRWDKLDKTAKNRVIAKQLTDDGFKPKDLKGLEGTDLTAFGTERVSKAGLVKPEATIASKEFGYKLTKGQMMPEETAAQRAAKFKQMSREEMLRSTESGQKFRDVEAGNVGQTDDNLQSIANKFGGPQSETSMEAAQRVHEGIGQAERSLKKMVDDAYGQTKDMQASLVGDAVVQFPKKIRGQIEAADVVLDELTPAASAAMKSLDDVAKRMTPKTEGAIIKDVSLADVERQRRKLAGYYDKALNNEDRRAVQIIKNAFDDNLDEVIDAKLFVGDDAALDQLKEARKLHADYSRKFRGKDEAGKVIQKIIDIDATPEQVANYMYGVNGLSKAGSGRIVKRYGEIVGRDSEAFQSLREAAFLTITRKPTGESKGAQALVSTLKRALEGQGSTMMKELYSEAELSTMKRFVQALDVTTAKGDFAKSSGTAERMMRFYQSGGFRNLPFVDTVRGVMENHGVKQALLPPVREINPISVLPAAGAYSSSQ